MTCKLLITHIGIINVENWKTKLANSKKADTYRLFKNMPKFDKYFDYIKNVKHLKAFIKFRVSDHKSLIEDVNLFRGIECVRQSVFIFSFFLIVLSKI